MIKKILWRCALGLVLMLGCTSARKPDTAATHPVPADSAMIVESEPVAVPVSDSDGSDAEEISQETEPEKTKPETMEGEKTDPDAGVSLQEPDRFGSISPLAFRNVTNHAFRTGEYLEFQIGWKFFKAGTATMSVSDTVWTNQRPCYFIETTASSSSVIDVFYKVRDKVESIIDRQAIFPWKFKKRLREGKFRRDRFTVFDPYQNLAYVKRDTVKIPPYVQDILSSFYYVRTLPLEVGRHFDIENITDKKVYPLRVIVHKKEKVKVPAGRFQCLVVEPVLRGEGLFNQKGTLTIWLTDDARKMPVMMKSEVFIGTVDVKLTQYKNTIPL